jgi:hypothetical protein
MWMRRHRGSYFAATRHPWPCLLFLLPLLVGYEAGVLWLGGAQPEALRNGADTWLRWGLEAFGLPQLYCAPALIIVVFLLWSWLRALDRPDDLMSVWTGMALESVFFALGLWGLSRQLGPLLDQLGFRMSLGPQDRTLARLITFVGAGIYEEVLFRLLLFFALRIFFRLMAVPALASALLTMGASALFFSAAHHIGPYGEALDGYVFLFRSVAGLYFALLYQLRGFGIAVGTHACYDVLVGVLMVS